MSNEVKVGDLVKDPALLKPGMRVRRTVDDESDGTLMLRDLDSWFADGQSDGSPDGAYFASDLHVSHFGVRIVALPAVAAPAKADDVPVGSRWRWRGTGGTFTVVGPDPCVADRLRIRYDDDGGEGDWRSVTILDDATRIDAPAETAPVARLYDKCRASGAPCMRDCTEPDGHWGPCEEAPLTVAQVLGRLAAAPAPEPRQDEAWSVHLEAEAKIRRYMLAWEGDEEKPRLARETREARAFIGDPPELRCTQWYCVNVTDTRRK